MGEEFAESGVGFKDKSYHGSPQETAAAPHFVLIHGIGGGAWCWYKIKTLMENSGYKVTCLDLRGAGMDPTDPNTILSFQDYDQPLIEFLRSLPHGQQVILVGHSAGGLSVTHALHEFGEKIKLAVFLAATMLKSGFLTDQDVKDGVPDLSDIGEVNKVYDFGFGLGIDHPPTSVIMKKKLQRELIYHMSSHEDSCLAGMLLRPGPVMAIQNAKFIGIKDVENVKRLYIKTTRDRVLKPEQQDAMIEKWPPSDVYVLESDHSPNFSAPFMLFGLLVKAAVSC